MTTSARVALLCANVIASATLSAAIAPEILLICCLHNLLLSREICSPRRRKFV
jgi:hypothetical protein